MNNYRVFCLNNKKADEHMAPNDMCNKYDYLLSAI